MKYDLIMKHSTGTVTIKRCDTADPARAIARAIDALGTVTALRDSMKEMAAEGFTR